MHRHKIVVPLAFALGSATPAWAAAKLTAEAVNAATFAVLPDKPSPEPVAEIVKAEVLLARAAISPGSIDGIDGENFRKAVKAFQRKAGLPDSGSLDQATWDKLSADSAPAMRRYTITEKDARGPFTRFIPAGFEQQSRLPRLGYRDVREALAERFHMPARLLVDINRNTALRAGQGIDVPAVDFPAPVEPLAAIVVDKTDKSVEAFGEAGQLLAVYPASIGSDEKPAPTGRFEIRRVVHNPDYTYEPKYAFKGVKSKVPFRIAPGPNNPVGSVWMDLSFEGYGIHGSPEPDRIGKTQSHGCIRLTNWDIQALAGLSKPGTPVFFQDGAGDPLHPAGDQPVTPAAPATPLAAPAPSEGVGPTATPPG